MKFAAALALDLKVALTTLLSGLSLWFADFIMSFESAMPAIAGIIATITGIIVGVSHYCKMVWDNHHARAKARLDEIEIEGERKDNELKDLLILEQKLKIKALEKQAEDNDS